MGRRAASLCRVASLLALALVWTLGLVGCAATGKGRAGAPSASGAGGTAEPVADLARLPQNALAYLDMPGKAAPLLPPGRQKARYGQFCARWFAPWHRTKPAFSAKDALWGFSAFKGTIWGQDLRPRPPEWLEGLQRNVRPATYPNLCRPAVALRRLDLRVLPTVEPVFYDPRKAGEGFPFDMNQNSAVQAGTPLFATQVTADGAWVLVEGPSAAGFVPARDIAFAGETFRARWESLPLAALIEDGAPLRAAGSSACPVDAPESGEGTGRFLATGRVGMVLPALSALGEMSLLLPADDGTGGATSVEALFPRGAAVPMPWPFTPVHVAALIDQLLGNPYGWGGIYCQRDCSASLQDIFTPFGLALPRNSAEQARSGPSVPLAGLSDADKRAAILAQGRPFATLLAMPGHILLYLGKWDGEPVVFQTVWGLRTNAQGPAGRLVIGRSVITGLAPGAERPEVAKPEGLLVHRLTAMTFIK
ncbi:NlpC/P60 family N-terminal domain-containing protein [Desulfovibrio sp. X2]|uniref:NlpC/P60 family N-terminal domain-containing protein n=1 Tax=Desulfovibrio sp. X2 TaxID=941449 RepID=UPI001268285D|nr:NlpC/P60 family N-terminal domain-containing protein [Desulfovibrio sp. X2]